jgi:hypothetical protein
LVAAEPVRVTFSELAERELNDAAQYYEHERSRPVGFIAEVRQCTETLTEHADQVRSFWAQSEGHPA